MNEFIELIGQAFAFLKKLAQRIIRGIMSFARDIVGWFRGLKLIPSRHTPFIGNGASPEFKKMLKSAPVKDVGVFNSPNQVFNGVYDLETDEIIHAELLSADQLDGRTKEIMGKEPIVVLS